MGNNQTSPEPVSDITVKRDILKVGQLDNGLNLYRFKYLWSEKEFVGVMAQEVQEVIPEAVFRTPEGLLNVNYDMVGTTFMPYSDWAANKPVFATV